MTFKTDDSLIGKASQIMRHVSGMKKLPAGIRDEQTSKLVAQLLAASEELAAIGDARDAKKAERDAIRKTLRARLTHIRAWVRAAYGVDSIAYAQVGGTRARDRKHGVRKPRTPPATRASRTVAA